MHTNEGRNLIRRKLIILLCMWRRPDYIKYYSQRGLLRGDEDGDDDVPRRRQVEVGLWMSSREEQEETEEEVFERQKGIANR